MRQATVLAVVIGIADVAVAFAMLWSMIRITTAAGVRSVQALWALGRRVIYASTAIAAFGLGIGRLNGDYAVASASEALFHLMMLVGIVAFPILRACNWITQDQFKSVDGSYERGTERGRT